MRPFCLGFPSSFGFRVSRSLHVGSATLLVFLAATAGAGFVAADLRGAVLNRFHNRHRRARAVWAGQIAVAAHGSRLGMADRRDLPERADKSGAFLLDTEDGRGDLLVDSLPHRQEGFAPF